MISEITVNLGQSLGTTSLELGLSRTLLFRHQSSKASEKEVGDDGKSRSNGEREKKFIVPSIKSSPSRPLRSCGILVAAFSGSCLLFLLKDRFP